MTATSAKTTEAAYCSVWPLSFSRFTSRNLSNHPPNSPINCVRRIDLGSQLGAELRLLHLARRGAGELVGFAKDETGGDFVAGQAFAAEGGQRFGGHSRALAQLDGGHDQ